jgi:hypothetical protein
MFSQPLQRFPRVEHKALKRLFLGAARITSLKRGVNEIRNNGPLELKV